MGGLLVACLVAPFAEKVDPQDQLFGSWQESQRGVKSLVVQFSLETKDRVFDERKKSEGTFRLVRTPKGEVFASYELTHAKAKEKNEERWSGLLNNDTVYLLNHDRKSAIRFKPTDGELLEFLEKHFNPFVQLLDRKRAQEKCQLDVVKQDEWYTYLSVKPKQVTDNFHQGRVALMNKASEGVPKDMPRQLWYTDGVQDYTFMINTWRLNGPDPPKREEFAKPEDRAGWEVIEWPFRDKK
jgi:hypothetical protein